MFKTWRKTDENCGYHFGAAPFAVKAPIMNKKLQNTIFCGNFAAIKHIFLNLKTIYRMDPQKNAEVIFGKIASLQEDIDNAIAEFKEKYL